MRFLHSKLGGDSLKERLLWTAALFCLVFFGVTVLSHFLLPEGCLKNRNPLQAWETSDNAAVLTAQIFGYNLLSVLVIGLGSLFASKKEGEERYLSYGYLAFFAMIGINGAVQGTWSFSVESDPVPLMQRLLRTFDLAHRAGLWEMLGQMSIACALARIATVRTSGSATATRRLRDIRLAVPERIALAAGFLLMLIGAGVESAAILGRVA